MRDTPLRCISGDLAVWESHILLGDKDHYGTILVCDRLADPHDLYFDEQGNERKSIDDSPAWHTRPRHFYMGHEVVWADRFLRPIRPHDPEQKKNDKILEQQIQRQGVTGVIAC